MGGGRRIVWLAVAIIVLVSGIGAIVMRRQYGDPMSPSAPADAAVYARQLAVWVDVMGNDLTTLNAVQRDARENGVGDIDGDGNLKQPIAHDMYWPELRSRCEGAERHLATLVQDAKRAVPPNEVAQLHQLFLNAATESLVAARICAVSNGRLDPFRAQLVKVGQIGEQLSDAVAMHRLSTVRSPSTR